MKERAAAISPSLSLSIYLSISVEEKREEEKRTRFFSYFRSLLIMCYVSYIHIGNKISLIENLGATLVSFCSTESWKSVE
jgi:hypothetical protein